MHSTVVKQCIVLTQLIIIMLSSLFLINLPGALQHDIMESLDMSISQYGLLYSVVNWAAIIDIVHGYLLDRYLNIKFATFLYCWLLLIGSICSCVAPFVKSTTLLLLGRTLMGFGLNPIMLCTNKHIIYWFSSGSYINLVYSVNESLIWLGSAASYFISVRLLKHLETYLTPSQSLAVTLCSETAVLTVLVIVASCILALMYNTLPGTDLIQSDKETTVTKDADNKLSWKDYVTLPCLFWTFSITIFVYFISILTFLSMSQVFFQTTYNVSTSYANTLSGFITAFGCILAPPFGLFLDRFGHNLTCLTAAFLLNIVSHGIFAFTTWTLLVPVGLMAVSIVLSSSLWSQFQYLVEEHQQMIAYGVAQTGLNGALAIGTFISGYIIEKYHYTGFMHFLFILIVCTLPALAIIWYLNYKRGNLLNLSPQKKMAFLGRSDWSKSETKENHNSNEVPMNL